MKLLDIIFEQPVPEELIRKKLNVLYRAFQKGKMKVNYHIFGRPVPTSERWVEIDVEYELPNLHRIVLNDKMGYFHSYWNNGKHTIYINDIKIKSDKPIPSEDMRDVKGIVKDKLEKRFRKMGDADLVFKTFTNDMNFESDFVQGDKLKLTVDQPIEHEKFGKGTILNLQTIGDRKVATIKFHGVGTKKIILNLAKIRTWD